MQHGSVLRALVHDTSLDDLMTSESYFQPVVLPSLVTSSGGLRYLKRVAVQALLLLLDDVLVGSNRLARKASHYTSLVLLLSDTHLLAVEGGKYYSTTILALPESVGFSLMAVTWLT